MEPRRLLAVVRPRWVRRASRPARTECSSIRRGYQVFTQVCATCHGLSRVAYRNLVGVCLTEEEAKTEAAKKEFPGEPDDSGDPTTRAGKLFDCTSPTPPILLTLI